MSLTVATHMNPSRAAALVVILLCFVSFTRSAQPYAGAPSVICPDNKDLRLQCNSLTGVPNANYVRILGIYGNVRCDSINVTDYKTAPNSCGGGDKFIRVELEANVFSTTGEGCFLEVNITYVSVDPLKPQCSIGSCDDTNNCVGLSSPIVVNVSISAVIYQHQLNPYNALMYPFEYARFTEPKSAVGYKSIRNETLAATNQYRCSSPDGCGSNPDTNTCRWRDDGDSSHKYCQTAKTLAEHYSYSRAACVKNTPAIYLVNGSIPDTSGVCQDCVDNASKCTGFAHLFPKITPVALVNASIDALGTTNVPITMSDGRSPNDVDPSIESATSISTGGFYCPLTSTNGDAAYFASLMNATAYDPGDRQGTWMATPITTNQILANISRNLNIRALDCGYCGPNTGTAYSIPGCKKPVIGAQRSWVMGMAPYCRLYQAFSNGVALYDARVKLTALKSDTLLPATSDTLITTGNCATNPSISSECPVKGFARSIGGIQSSLFIQISSTPTTDVMAADPLGSSNSFFMICSATPGAELYPYYRPNALVSSPWVGRTNPINNAPNCGYCMPDQQPLHGYAFWWYLSTTTKDQFISSDVKQCDRKMGLDSEAWDTDDCDLMPGTADTSHCPSDRSQDIGLQSLLCSLTNEYNHMCRPLTTPCSVAAMYNAYRKALLDAKLQSITIPPNARQGLAPFLPNFWNDKSPNMWLSSRPSKSSGSTYIGSVQYTMNGGTNKPKGVLRYRITNFVGAAASQPDSAIPLVGLVKLNFTQVCNLAAPPPNTELDPIARGTAEIGQLANQAAVVKRYRAVLVFPDPITCTVVNAVDGTDTFLVGPQLFGLVNITCNRNTKTSKLPTNKRGEMTFYGENVKLSTLAYVCSCCQVSGPTAYNPLQPQVCKDDSTGPCVNNAPSATPTPAVATPTYVPSKPATTPSPNGSTVIPVNASAPTNATADESDVKEVNENSEDTNTQLSYIIIGVICLFLVIGVVVIVIIVVVEKKKGSSRKSEKLKQS
jgi:hypothetical protein